MIRVISQDALNSQCLGQAVKRVRSARPLRHTVASGASATVRDGAIQNAESEKDLNLESGERESIEARIERLGRQRPAIFSSIWAEIAFVFSIMMSQIVTEYFVSGFNVILPRLIEELEIPAGSSVWPATAFSLVIASTLLVFGRLADMFGGYPVYVLGFAWLMVWSIITGFSINPLMLDLCRALQGFGPAAFLPSGVMLLGSVYRPGLRKNLVFSLYGTCAVLGFFIGIFFAGVVAQFAHWVPNDYAEKRKNNIQMDWNGTLLIVSGLVLFVFAITESSHAPNGWKTPYIPVLLVVGCVFLGLAVYVEGWCAQSPLLPFDIFAVKSMLALLLGVLLNYGTLGIFLLYGTLYFQQILGATPLQVVAWYIPMILGGIVLSTAGGFVLHLIPGQALLVFSGGGWIGASLLLALMPVGASYWAFVLPAMILATVGIDITFNIATIFITTEMPSERQGLAGGLINSVLHLGIAICLGFSDVIQTETLHLGLRKSYKSTFWFAVATASVALLVMIFFVKVKTAKSDLTADEKREVELATGKGEETAIVPGLP
ncbi:hypothetical protein LTR70_009429 [Exophiala xenobiotica]|uniref:Major facilitator superfamily (MFS) profile domain-containing protein n=1 Tax=Lithohypha guttulata TaxID=1690604 RepID=A0ABR0JZ07_9EURO|nr:hypothetical protein LTR24_009291 [Lithohypha guttulata]KAK5310504.1 hypothetical protein LTR70_009429 [Exophiala xenobiotica]